MFRRVQTLVLAAGLALVGMGCSDGAVSFHYYDPPPPRHVTVVQVEPGHICTPACVHYYDGGRYIVVKRGHHHGPGCGHVFDGGRWMVAVAVASPGHVHVCTHECHQHYWNGSKLVVLKGHRHGPGCGHVFEGSHWVVAVVGGHDVGVVKVHKAPAARVHHAPARVVEVGPPPGPVHLYVFDRRGSKWLKIAKGHSHGPGCGHVHVEGRWSLP